MDLVPIASFKFEHFCSSSAWSDGRWGLYNVHRKIFGVCQASCAILGSWSLEYSPTYLSQTVLFNKCTYLSSCDFELSSDHWYFGCLVGRACYGILRYVMESGAKGCEVWLLISIPLFLPSISFISFQVQFYIYLIPLLLINQLINVIPYAILVATTM